MIDPDDEHADPTTKAHRQPTAEAIAGDTLREAFVRTEEDANERRDRQLEYLRSLGEHIDLLILRSGEMWR